MTQSSSPTCGSVVTADRPLRFRLGQGASIESSFSKRQLKAFSKLYGPKVKDFRALDVVEFGVHGPFEAFPTASRGTPSRTAVELVEQVVEGVLLLTDKLVITHPAGHPGGVGWSWKNVIEAGWTSAADDQRWFYYSYDSHPQADPNFIFLRPSTPYPEFDYAAEFLSRIHAGH